MRERARKRKSREIERGRGRKSRERKGTWRETQCIESKRAKIIGGNEGAERGQDHIEKEQRTKKGGV